MGQLTPVLESQPLSIYSGAIDYTGPTAVSSIMKVGAPSDENGLSHAGVVLEVAVTPEGGTADSDVTIDVYRSFDAVNVDDEVAFTSTGDPITKTLAAADIGSTGTYRASFVLRADVHVGYAFRLRLSTTEGDRGLAIVVRARRWHWRDTLG